MHYATCLWVRKTSSARVLLLYWQSAFIYIIYHVWVISCAIVPTTNAIVNYFHFSLNSTCNSTSSDADIIHPSVSYVHEYHQCVLQEESHLFSCEGQSENACRICPCRRYRKYQIALPDWHYEHTLPLFMDFHINKPYIER